MPWMLQKSGGRYFVVDAEGKRYSKNPMSRRRAKAQMDALYANEGKETLLKGDLPARAFLVVEDPEKVSTWHLPVRNPDGTPNHALMGAAWAALHGGYRGQRYQGPGKESALSALRKLYAQEEMVTPAERRLDAESRRSRFGIFKQADGQYRWVAISSSAFRDRDGEIVTEKALADDVQRCDATGSYGPLRWWHLGGWEAPDGLEKWDTWKAGDGVDLGVCDFNMLHGKMLIESGTFTKPEVGEALQQSQANLQMSIGFSHPPNEPGESKQYENIHRFERSLLPEGMASNVLTKYYVVKGELSMKTQEKLAALVAILRGRPEVAQQILTDAESVQKAAEAAGLEFKEVEAMISGIDEEEEAAPVVEAAAEAPPPVTEPIPEAPVAKEGEVPAGDMPGSPPPAEEEPDEIGDMSHADLKLFVTEVVKELLAPQASQSASKQAEMDTVMADAVTGLKSLGERYQAQETAIEALRVALFDLTDARPVGIKQLQSRRPTESAENISKSVPAGPHMDDAFVSFLQGGK